MKITLTTILIAFASVCSSQPIDISGTWVGSSTFLKDHYRVMYVLEQDGTDVSGKVESRSEDDKQSITYTVKGKINTDQIELVPQKILEKNGLSCMAGSTLSYSTNNGEATLTGRWKGDAKFNTCPPLTSGAVTLFLKKHTVKLGSQEEPKETEIQHISDKDIAGKALVSELSKRKYYALLIGINDYPDTKIQNLDNPIKDASRLARVLTEHYSFESKDVSVLQNPTREGIIKALDQLVRMVTEKDHVLIFYAGHGVWNAQLNQGYWLPSDASLHSKSHWLSNSTLRDYVGGIKSKHTLLISDACFSGGILKERAVFDNSRAILEVYKLPSRKAMTSGTLKTVPDQSVFIEYLLKNLMNNTAPLLSADQLFRSFKAAVINNSPNGQVPQYGPISQAGDEGGDFVFLRD